ncbi:MFS transporter [Streptomyces rubellomurinus]|uniref:Major facilitator transporter n=1 Tax=Streptomyces rubellomurinus (strain ATCC 31215) TaxID=359131 RepID=A0A0F2TLJ6_STRR3|nr:MFS transporter [Streptomyces rubellomurinus]KJS63155.1 major facilitator transporter [Streptomyces rubellomurinus]
MLTVLRNRTYRRLFTAQVVALVGTGLATVALALLAYDIAGANASVVLGTALAIKMVAYVAVAPIAGALAGRIPRRALLVATDLTRAGVALALPFVDQVWQIYLMVLLLQAASAAFTPTFQATIPHVLPAERDYTNALSMSRLAYDLESLFSPALAAVLLTLVSYNWLFAGTSLGFLASAALVLSAVLPKAPAAERAGGVYAKALSGTRMFWATPRLRALLALDLAVAAAGAIVFVNTVVVVREHFQRPAGAVSLALGAYGAGSMLTALLLPRLLARVSDRAVMLPAALALPAVLGATAVITAAPPGTAAWLALLAAWALIGAASSAVLTPGGRVVRRSAADAELPAAFAAQFSLSHACWLLTYPLAGWLAAGAGLPVTALVLGAVALTAALGAVRLWPRRDPDALDHVHTDLPADHPHLAGARPAPAGAWSHGHRYVIDRNHRSRPRHA